MYRQALSIAANRILGCVRRIAAFDAVKSRPSLERADPYYTSRLRAGLSPAAPSQVALIRRRHDLPTVIEEFFLHSQSRFFFDTGLVCGGVSCSLVTAEGFENANLAYAGQEGWPADRFVVALENEGCYFVDKSEAQNGDAAVYYFEHRHPGSPDGPVEATFTGFLETVANDSLEGASPLEVALSQGDPSAISRELRDHRRRRNTPLALSLAVLHGREPMASLLLDAGEASLDEDPVLGVTPLALAMSTEQDSIVECLAARASFEAAAFEKTGLTRYAARRGLNTIVTRALHAGIDASRLLEDDEMHGTVLRSLAAAGFRARAPARVFASAARAHALRGEVRPLLDLLGDAPGLIALPEHATLLGEALAVAAERGDLGAVNAALEFAQRSTESGTSFEPSPAVLETALVRATASGQPASVDRLLSVRAARELPARCASAVREAARRGFLELIDVLLSSGAGPDEPDAHGVTALMLAAGNGHVDVVELLLQNGADADRRDALGRNAHAYAMRSFNDDAKELLTEAGAEALLWTEPQAEPAKR